MTQIYEELLDKSISAALSSIEMYNKPDLKYREEIFTILIINSWELLLKAKILKNTNNSLESLYVLDNQSKKYKLSRNGNPLTIDINGAMSKIGLDKAVFDNIKYLIEIRDTAIHLYHDGPLTYLLYTLSVACLQNYQKLTRL